MAKIKKGVNGPISGKVGEIVGSSWNGVDYIKRAPVRKKPPTEGELRNRHVFSLTQKWLNPISDFLRVGFRDFAPTNKGVNAAKSYLYRHALHKDGYDSSIDPSLMLVSFGSLGMASGMQAELNGNRELLFSWDPSSGKGMAPEDQVMLLAYNTEDGQAYWVVNGAFRKNGQDKLVLNGGKGTFHVYAAFVASDRSRQSESVYLGTVALA